MRVTEGDMELTCILAAAGRWLTAFLRQQAVQSALARRLCYQLILEDLAWRTKE